MTQQPSSRQSGGQPGGDWLAEQAAGQPRQVTRAGQIIAAGGRTNDSALHGRQFLERALGADPQASFGARDYRTAARRVEDAGRSAHGDVLETIAAADAELRAPWPAWERRYDDRPQTAAERDADAQIRLGAVVEKGKAGHGVDGAWYTRAYYTHSGRPAVVVTSSALTEELAPFASVAEADAWLRSRAPDTTGPLLTSANGPALPRTVKEEEVLARLLRVPSEAASMAALLGPGTWSTHLRAELFTTLRWLTSAGGTPDYSGVAEAFTRRLLRAPGWAADDIGWPNATRAMSYLQRLAATTVTAGQARLAAEALAHGDAVAVNATQSRRAADARASRPQRPAHVPTVRPSLPPAQVRAAGPPLLQPPPGLQPGPGGPVPRM
jgi:hypothetical protein